MNTFQISAERAPLVWVLVGLLFSATGLFLGFEFMHIFVYLGIGGFCVVFGVALGVLQFRETPKVSPERRLSPNFVSAIPAPLCIGRLELEDGSAPQGFLCESAGLEGSEDISAWGGWRAWCASRPGD